MEHLARLLCRVSCCLGVVGWACLGMMGLDLEIRVYELNPIPNNYFCNNIGKHRQQKAQKENTDTMEHSYMMQVV